MLMFLTWADHSAERHAESKPFSSECDSGGEETSTERRLAPERIQPSLLHVAANKHTESHSFTMYINIRKSVSQLFGQKDTTFNATTSVKNIAANKVYIENSLISIYKASLTVNIQYLTESSPNDSPVWGVHWVRFSDFLSCNSASRRSSECRR